MYEIYSYPYGNPDAKLLLYRPNDPQALVLSPKLTREVSKGCLIQPQAAVKRW